MHVVITYCNLATCNTNFILQYNNNEQYEFFNNRQDAAGGPL